MKTHHFLVTGAAGFIGSTLIRVLRQHGHRVTAIDVFTDYYDPGLKRANFKPFLSDKSITLHELDINDIHSIQEATSDVDHVIHLAAQPGVRNSWGSEFSVYTRDNINATQALLEYARGLPNLKSFVYASSSSVYGNAETYPTSEARIPQPYSPYGVSKLAAEHLAGLYASNFGVPTRSLRFFTVYGPRQRPDMAFTRFFSRIRDGKPLQVHGDGSQVREFTYVDDIVDAVYRTAVAAELPGGVVMNVSGGSTVSLQDVLKVIRGDLGLDFDVHYGPSIPGDVRRTGGTTSLIQELTGWHPTVLLSEGLARQWSWITSDPSALAISV